MEVESESFRYERLLLNFTLGDSCVQAKDFEALELFELHGDIAIRLEADAEVFLSSVISSLSSELFIVDPYLTCFMTSAKDTTRWVQTTNSGFEFH